MECGLDRDWGNIQQVGMSPWSYRILTPWIRIQPEGYRVESSQGLGQAMDHSWTVPNNSIKGSKYMYLPRSFFVLVLGCEGKWAPEEMCSWSHLCITEKIKSWVPYVRTLDLWLQRVYTPRGTAKLIPSATRIDLTLVLTSKYILKIGYLLNGLAIAFSGRCCLERWGIQNGAA